MCIPMAALAVAATVASTVVSAAGSMAAANAQAAAAESDARMLEDQAKQRKLKAEYDVGIAERDYRRDKGSRTAQIAASGIDPRSFDDVLADDAAEAALERQAIRYSGANDAFQLQQQSNNKRAEAASAKQGGFYAAAGAVLGGFSSLTKMK